MDSEQRTMGILSHVLGLITGFLGPLILYLIVTEDKAFARQHAKEALNFQITIAIAFFISGITIVFFIGILGFIVFGLLDLIFSIMGAVAASNEQEYRYPLSIRFIS